jgi:outer membrane protein assembly factor BamE (lipoprotein component of BamABCDE complex)
MRRVIVLFTALLIWSAAAGARGAEAQYIDPGMTKSQVVERLGKPWAERTIGAFTYLFYSNGREEAVGMSDLITLQNDAVVDAIFRSPSRQYTGKSSSPEGKMPQNSAPSGERLAIPVESPANGPPPPPEQNQTP